MKRLIHGPNGNVAVRCVESYCISGNVECAYVKAEGLDYHCRLFGDRLKLTSKGGIRRCRKCAEADCGSIAPEDVTDDMAPQSEEPEERATPRKPPRKKLSKPNTSIGKPFRDIAKENGQARIKRGHWGFGGFIGKSFNYRASGADVQEVLREEHKVCGVRTLDDMSEAEVKALEAQYGCEVKR